MYSFTTQKNDSEEKFNNNDYDEYTINEGTKRLKGVLKKRPYPSI